MKLKKEKNYIIQFVFVFFAKYRRYNCKVN